ncbi:hypothetical protein QE152_g27372 [Popillia japonica]|uniref:Uncharacterized protein n=1 Tax=Popillia japonica TaxID=7064 RepID=A0AAW1JVV2_POPJA
MNEVTIKCGSAVMFKLSDMTHSSKMGWNTIRKLSGNPTESKQATNGNPNQIVHQLRRLVRVVDNETNILGDTLTIKKVNHANNIMRNGKSPRVVRGKTLVKKSKIY